MSVRSQRPEVRGRIYQDLNIFSKKPCPNLTTSIKALLIVQIFAQNWRIFFVCRPRSCQAVRFCNLNETGDRGPAVTNYAGVTPSPSQSL